MQIERPIASLAEYPSMRTAAWFHESIVPSSVLPITASLDDSTIVANQY